MKNLSQELSFFEHLDELRERLIKCILALVIGAGIFYSYSASFLEMLVQPVGGLIFTSVHEAFLARITVTLLGGFFLALPVILYQIWRFVSSALTLGERRYILLLGPLSFLCFIIGAVFGYFVMIPISLGFLLSFATPSIVAMITVSRYISFIGTMILAFGVVFELPLILMFLTKIGIATPEFLRQKRRYSIVLILILSAFLTPPDVITQLVMAGPLLLLYEVGIIVSQFTLKTSVKHEKI